MHPIQSRSYLSFSEMAVSAYGIRDLGQQWFRSWLVAWWHQAITWTTVDLSSVRSCCIQLRALSWEDLMIPIIKTSLKIVFVKLYPELPGTNGLKIAEILFSLNGLPMIEILSSDAVRSWYNTVSRVFHSSGHHWHYYNGTLPLSQVTAIHLKIGHL